MYIIVYELLYFFLVVKWSSSTAFLHTFRYLSELFKNKLFLVSIIRVIFQCKKLSIFIVKN